MTIRATAKSAGQKSNKAFMLLSALGILFVVDAHLGQPLNILTGLFPYNSFFMPMFAFISGYFFKDTVCTGFKEVVCYGIKKFRRLMLPYLGWLLFYNFLNGTLSDLGIWNIQAVSLRELIYGVVTSGVILAFNSPAWFAPLLFCVSVFYALIRWCFRNHWNDCCAAALLILLGTAAVWVAGTDWNVPLCYMLLKVPFFLQFFHLGLLFKKRIEPWFHRTNAAVICIGAAACNFLLICIYGGGVEFPICSAMAGFQTDNPLLPLITSVTGIAFWLKICHLLAPILGQNRLINYISDNTFFIMTHHIGAKHLFIALCVLANHLGITACSGIDMQQFLSDGLYLYTAHSWCAPACFLFLMVILLLTCRMCQCIAGKLRNLCSRTC